MTKLKLAIIFTACMIGQVSFAQSRKDTLNYDVYSIKEYQPVIGRATKINENPVINDSTKKVSTTPIVIYSNRIETYFKVDTIKPAKIVNEPLQKLYKTLVKGGMGNYATAYGELFFNNLRSKEISYGAHLKHLSSSSTLKNTGFSGFSDNLVNVYGKKFLKNHILSGDLEYNRNVVHAYGYDVSLFELKKDVTRQQFNDIAAQVVFQTLEDDSTKPGYAGDIKFYNFSDSYKSMENNISGKGRFGFRVGKELVSIHTALMYDNYVTASDTSNNTVFTLNPSINSSGNNWTAKVGMGLAIDHREKTSFSFYPDIRAQYSIADDVVVPFAGLTGRLNQNTFKRFANENPFILSDVELKNSDTKLEFFGGLKGTISSNTSYLTRLSFSKINNMFFYVNDTVELVANKFDVIYDNGTLLNLHGEVAFNQREKIRFLASGDYFSYKMDTEVRAWHKPSYQLTFSTHYNLKQKIVLNADVFFIGKQFAKTFASDTIAPFVKVVSKELKGIVDINLGVEYRYNARLSAFVNLNNLAASRYFRWNNYPTQRFNILGGVSFAF